MPEEQVFLDVDRAIGALALGHEPRRGILSGFTPELYSALSFLVGQSNARFFSDRLDRLLRWREWLGSPRAQAAAGSHFGAAHGTNVDPDRLWRHVRAVVATAAAAQAARSCRDRAEAHEVLIPCLAEAAALLGGQGAAVTGAAEMTGSPHQVVERACRLLQAGGWDITATRLWTIRWLEDPPEPVSLARLAMVDTSRGEGLIGELRLYTLPPGSPQRLVVDLASALLPVGRKFLTTLHEVWDQASSPRLSWSLALPAGIKADELDGPSASGAIRVAMEVIGGDLADSSCLVLGRATQDGRLVHADIGRLDEKLQAAKQAGITRIVTGAGAPHVAEPGLKVTTVETVREAVAIVTSREPYVRITQSFPTFQDSFGMSSQLNELSQLAYDNRVLVLHGLSGAGKTYLAAGLAARLAADRQVAWLEQEGMGLADFLAEVQRIFTQDQYLSSIVGYAEIPDQHKLLRIVDALASQRVALFVENFQRARRQEFIPFLEQFLKFGDRSVIVLMDHDAPASWAGSHSIKSYPFSGFDRKDADQYLRERSPITKWSDEQLNEVYLRTDGHALALWAICQWLSAHHPLREVLQDLPKFGTAASHELGRKLIRDVSETLKHSEFEALQRASVFRVPFDRTAWADLGISPEVGRELESRGRLVVTSSGELRIHPLVREFWYQAMIDQRPWHAAAARHYVSLASGVRGEAAQVGELVEAHYHFLRAGDHARAIEVADRAVQAVHETEPVASNRLPSLSQWVMELPQKDLAAHPWLLIEQGRLFQAQGRDGASRTAFMHVLNSINASSGSAAACVTHYCLAKLFLSVGDARAAITELQKALGEASSDVRMQVRVLGKMIDCFTDLENYSQADSTAQELKSLAKEIGDELGEALTIYRAGRINRRRGQFRHASNEFKDSAKMFAAVRDDYRRAKALARAGIVLSQLGQLKDAEDNLRHAIAIKKRIGDRHGLARDNDYLADVNVLQGRYREAEELYKESARQKGDETGSNDKYGQIKTFNNLGRLYLLRGELNRAEHALRASASLIGLPLDQPLSKPLTLDHIQARRLIGVEGTRLTNVGDLLFARGEFHEALQAYRYAAARFSAPYPLVPYSLARAQIGIGIAAFALGDIAEATMCLQGGRATRSLGSSPEPAKMPTHSEDHPESSDALGMARHYGFRVLEASVLTHISRIRAQLGKIQEAKDLNSSALAIATRTGARYVAASCRLTEAIIIENDILLDCFQDIGVAASESTTLLNEVMAAYGTARLGFEDIAADWDIAEVEVRRRIWQLTARLLTAYQDRLRQQCKGVSGGLTELRKLTTEFLTITPVNEDDAFTFLVSDVPRQAVRTALLRALGVSKSLYARSPQLASQLSRQLLHLWAPMAGRLGHTEWKAQIEGNAFAYLFPAKLAEIVQALDLQRSPRSELLGRIVLEIQIYANFGEVRNMAIAEVLKNPERRQEIARLSRWEVRPRLKSPYSIFRKQQATGSSLHNILDIAGIRIITNTEEECRQALDLVRTMGEPFRGQGLLTAEVRDYILEPKASGYQSIHINRKFAILKSRIIVEFQIRTREMHLAAEFGLGGLGLLKDPSHARYKSGPAYGRLATGALPPMDPASERRVTVICNQDKLRRIGNALGTFQTLNVHRVDLATIRGTAAAESVVLHLYLRARATRSRAHMDSLIPYLKQAFGPYAENVLVNGEDVSDEIRLSNEEKAHLLIELASTFPDSVYAVTPKGDIRRLPRGATVLDFAYTIHTEVGHRATRALVDGRLVPFGHVLRSGAVVEIVTSRSPGAGPNIDWLNTVYTSKAKKKIQQWFKHERRVEALEKGRDVMRRTMRKHGLSPGTSANRKEFARVVDKLGYRSVDTLYVAIGDGSILPESVIGRMFRILSQEFEKQAQIAETVKQNTEAQTVPVIVPGATGTWVRLARCCSPAPVDKITGYVSQGNGISVHRVDCPNIALLRKESKPLIQVHWQSKRRVAVLVEAHDRPRLLGDIAGALADAEVNVLSSRTTVGEDQKARMRFDFEISAEADLRRILRYVRQVKGVLNIQEIIGERLSTSALTPKCGIVPLALLC
jgi:(p)ppGpp synthase/HD superfamily hydrolase/tetratricopeptide (TPR) repeat protein